MEHGVQWLLGVLHCSTVGGCTPSNWLQTYMPLSISRGKPPCASVLQGSHGLGYLEFVSIGLGRSLPLKHTTGRFHTHRCFPLPQLVSPVYHVCRNCMLQSPPDFLINLAAAFLHFKGTNAPMGQFAMEHAQPTKIFLNQCWAYI